MTSTFPGEKVRAFVPPPLLRNPRALDLAPLQAILAEANPAIGRLDGTTSSLPDLKLFLYSYVRKEAVLSSQIEGTQSSLSDLLLYENAETPNVALDDVQEVAHCSAPYLRACSVIELRTGIRIWLAAGVTDLRRGFHGLSAQVQTVLNEQPYSGHVFVFRSPRP